jgi:hypothetical protein
MSTGAAVALTGAAEIDRPNKELRLTGLLAHAQSRALPDADVGSMPQGAATETARLFMAHYDTMSRGETVEAAPQQVHQDRSSRTVQAPVVPTGMEALHRDPYIHRYQGDVLPGPYVYQAGAQCGLAQERPPARQRSRNADAEHRRPARPQPAVCPPEGCP